MSIAFRDSECFIVAESVEAATNAWFVRSRRLPAHVADEEYRRAKDDWNFYWRPPKPEAFPFKLYRVCHDGTCTAEYLRIYECPQFDPNPDPKAMIQVHVIHLRGWSVPCRKCGGSGKLGAGCDDMRDCDGCHGTGKVRA